MNRSNAWSENADPEGRQVTEGNAFAERNKKGPSSRIHLHPQIKAPKRTP